MKTTKTVMVAMVAVVTALATATETEDSTPLDTTGGHTINVAAGDTLVYSGKITGPETILLAASPCRKDMWTRR